MVSLESLCRTKASKIPSYTPVVIEPALGLVSYQVSPTYFLVLQLAQMEKEVR